MSVFLRTRSPKLLKGHTRSVRRGLAIRNNKLYSASVDGTIRVWNTDTHEEIAILKVEVEEPLKEVTCFVIHENKLYSGCTDRTIRVWNIDTHEEIATMRGYGYSGRVNCLAIHDNKLYSGSFEAHNNFNPDNYIYDHSIRVWNTNTYKEITSHIVTLEGLTNSVFCLAIHENKLFSCGDEHIRVWNTDTYKQINTLEGTMYEGMTVHYLTVHENKLYSGSENDFKLRIWNIDTYEQIACLNTGVVRCIIFNENKMYIASGQKVNMEYNGDGYEVDTNIRVWNTDTHQPIATMEGHTKHTSCLAFYENRLFSGGNEANIRVWNV